MEKEVNKSAIFFYEGNDATQSVVLRNFINNNISKNLKKDKNSDNDEIRSIKLFNVPKGTVIKVYDSPNASVHDDYTVITVIRKTSEFVIGTLEQSGKLAKLIDGDFIEIVNMTYFNDNGLDGKVSHVYVKWP